MEDNKSVNIQANNPLHGVKLVDIIEKLVDEYGWEQLAEKINIRCFKSNPSVKSCLKFLRKTQWARHKVEYLYLQLIIYLNEYDNINNDE